MEIAQFDGSVYAHPSNPATTWRFWIKRETIENVLSIDPAGGTNGVEAITGGLDLIALGFQYVLQQGPGGDRIIDHQNAVCAAGAGDVILDHFGELARGTTG